MGLLDQLSAALGGGSGTTQQLQNMANGQADFSQPQSPDQAGLSSMISHAPPGMLGQIFSSVAGGMNPQQYSDHVTPGVNGTNPLGGLESAALGMVASAFISKLTGSGGYSSSSLLSKIPGLGTTDPSQMNATQVAQVAQYTQQNHPDLFGQATAQVAQQQPGVLGALLGHSGLSQGAAALASHFLQGAI